jgi:transposase InsO family protein
MPGRPDQNGRHERMHRTLKAETARAPASSMRAQQARFDRFLDEYNNVRPHEALGQATPACSDGFMRRKTASTTWLPTTTS